MRPAKRSTRTSSILVRDEERGGGLINDTVLPGVFITNRPVRHAEPQRLNFETARRSKLADNRLKKTEGGNERSLETARRLYNYGMRIRYTCHVVMLACYLITWKSNIGECKNVDREFFFFFHIAWKIKNS